METDTGGPADNAAPLLRLSRECLLPLAEFDLESRDGQLVVARMADHWTAAQRDLLATMVSLYNDLEMVAKFQEASPLLARDMPDAVWRAVLRGRSPRRTSALNQDLKNRGLEATVARRFLAGRALAVEDAGTPCLSPFLDLFPHHDQGARPVWDDQGLALAETRAVKGARTCFRRHGALDALDLLLDKGVVDGHCETVSSIPLRIDLPRFGVIEVLAEAAPAELPLMPDDTAPPALMPPVGYVGSTATLTRLPIGGAAQPRILIRILGAVLRKMAERSGRRPHKDHLKLAEAQVVLSNRVFYEDLAGQLRDIESEIGEAVPAMAPLNRVLERQRTVLNEYRMVS